MLRNTVNTHIQQEYSIFIRYPRLRLKIDAHSLSLFHSLTLSVSLFRMCMGMRTIYCIKLCTLMWCMRVLRRKPNWWKICHDETCYLCINMILFMKIVLIVASMYDDNGLSFHPSFYTFLQVKNAIAFNHNADGCVRCFSLFLN